MEGFRFKWLSRDEVDKLGIYLVDKGPIVRFDNYKWYFWDVSYEYLNGPYETEEEVRNSAKDYAKSINIELS